MTNDSTESDLTTAVAEPADKITSRPTAGYGDAVRDLWRKIAWRKVGLFVISLFLFLLALTLMKDGARGLAPLLENRFVLQNAANSLGFGWLFASIIMSGSPVAASALTFFDAGILTVVQTFTMIVGSRMGASFIILFIGMIYVLRGRDRANSLSMGLLSFTVTGTLQAGAVVLGILMLNSGVLERFDLGQGMILTTITDVLFEPISAFLQSILPTWGLFIVGLVLILFTFNLFDKCLPEMTLKESQVGRVSRLVYKPIVMFLLGAGITLVSMSVSVSLSILVPLSQRGFVRRENVIPYIMGANITTFIDTLLAAVLLNNPAGVTIVIAQMLSVAITALILLLTIYRPYNRYSLKFVKWVTRDNRHLALFMFSIFAIPIALLLI